MEMERILVSSCLLGAKVRYHGGDALSDDAILRGWRDEGRLVAVCPEQDGGLPTPRPAAEIVGGDGRGVFARVAVVRTASAADVTDAFRRGAESALAVARQHGVRMAVLKDGSPSCGSAQVYDGTFSGTRVSGVGVTTAVLEAHGIRVFSDRDTAAAAAYLAHLERRAE